MSLSLRLRHRRRYLDSAEPPCDEALRGTPQKVGWERDGTNECSSYDDLASRSLPSCFVDASSQHTPLKTIEPGG